MIPYIALIDGLYKEDVPQKANRLLHEVLEKVRLCRCGIFTLNNILYQDITEHLKISDNRE